MPDHDLPDRLSALKTRYPTATVDLVAEVADAVMRSMQGDLSTSEAGLLGEIEDLARTIASARAQIAALRVDDISTSHIPSATDELDAIVAHTAAATNAILEVCETLDNVAAELQHEAAPLADRLQEATTRIYEACSFQDITGQRISKVVATLKTIDRKVARIMSTFDTRTVPLVESKAIDTILLNGPQLPTAAMGQTDIDKLLASFD
jgi:chemotaxis protein CheZ